MNGASKKRNMIPKLVLYGKKESLKTKSYLHFALGKEKMEKLTRVSVIH